MSLVPLLFRDWWDDIDHERPSRLLDQHFGVGLRRDDLLSNWSSLSPSLLRPGRYYRPWKNSIARSTSGTSNITNDEKQFQVILDVQQFSPNEITVKIADGSAIVEGKHDEKQDEHGFVYRHFVRRYVLPKDSDVDNIVSSLSSDGILTVTVPKRTSLTTGERFVPIIQTGSPVERIERAERAEKPAVSTETKIPIEREAS